VRHTQPARKIGDLRSERLKSSLEDLYESADRAEVDQVMMAAFHQVGPVVTRRVAAGLTGFPGPPRIVGTRRQPETQRLGYELSHGIEEPDATSCGSSGPPSRTTSRASAEASLPPVSRRYPPPHRRYRGDEALCGHIRGVRSRWDSMTERAKTLCEAVGGIDALRRLSDTSTPTTQGSPALSTAASWRCTR